MAAYPLCRMAMRMRPGWESHLRCVPDGGREVTTSGVGFPVCPVVGPVSVLLPADRSSSQEKG
jgi:hypothetical protein